jgi:hypothetical protein
MSHALGPAARFPARLTAQLPPDRLHQAQTVVAETRAEYARGATPALHRQLLGELIGEIRDCVPFPSGMVSADPLYRLQDQVVDIAPHSFALAELIDTLNWATQLLLTQGSGSFTNKPDLLASRGASYLHVHALRQLKNGAVPDEQDAQRALFAATLQAGNCPENAAVGLGLAQSLDQATLAAMGIRIDPSKLAFATVGDRICDHAYGLVNHADDGAFDWADARMHAGLWSIDAHQLYPMPTRYDHSLYNHPHAQVRMLAGPRHAGDGTASPAFTLDLGEARALRESLAERLGPAWAQGPHAQLTASDRALHRDVVAAMQAQGVNHYTQIDLSSFGVDARARLEQQLAQLDERLSARRFGWVVQQGATTGTWAGLCQRSNPDLVYRNRETGQHLAPMVPSHYLEITERKRWAWAVYEAATAAPTSAPRWAPVHGVGTPIPAAVEAIEQEPFLAALAGARAMDYRFNGVRPSGLPAFETALAVLEAWVDRMHHANSPTLRARIAETGLDAGPSLAAVQRNLSTLADVAKQLADQAQDGEQRSRAGALHAHAVSTPAHRQAAELVEQWRRGD